MTKKAKQLLSILGRENATFCTVQKTQSVLDTKKNAREILGKIIKEILFLQSISDRKFNNAIDFLGGNVNLHNKICVKCYVSKDISEFYLTPKNQNLHCWCLDCRRFYNTKYVQKIRQKIKQEK